MAALGFPVSEGKLVKNKEILQQDYMLKIPLQEVLILFVPHGRFRGCGGIVIAAKVQHAVNNHPVQLIFKRSTELFGIAFYSFNRNKNFSFYRLLFFVVMKRNNIGKKMMLQKFFVDVE